MSAQSLYLSFETENTIPKTLKDSILPITTFKNYLELKKENDTLIYRFQKNGFIDATLKNLKKENDSTYISHWFLGNRWDNITITYQKQDFNINSIKKYCKQVTDSSFTLSIKYTEIVLEEIAKTTSEDGDPFSKVFLSAIKKQDNKTLLATLNKISNKKRTVDGIVVKGYDKYPASFLKYYAGVKKGKTFSQKKIIAQNNILNNLGFLNSIKPPEALFKKDSTIVYFYLEKTNNNLFDGILGFATNEETQNIEFNGYLNLELNNNLNFGEQLLINYKADGREQQNFRVRTQLPYLFKSPFGVSLELNIFKRDSTFATTEQQARLLYQYSPRLKGYVGYKQYESSNLQDEIIVTTDVDDYNANYLLAGANYSKQQKQSLFPLKTFIDIEAEIGERTIDALSEDQIRINTTVSHIFNLNDRNSIFLKNETRFFSSDSYLVNELYRFGGINSIRGFNENSIDASFYSVLNTEYRYLLNDTSFIHSIIDTAFFENKILNTEEQLYSFGIGLGLNTKAGLFIFNIANGVSKNQNFNAGNTKIHLSLYSRF